MKYPTREEGVKFIVDFVKEPSEEKSVFGKRAFQRFSVMPSMKGIMSDEDFQKVAEYIYDNYPWSNKDKNAALNYFKNRKK